MKTATQEKAKQTAASVGAAASTNIVPVQERTLTISQKFVMKISRQFQASCGSPISWTALQNALAQNLYIKIDQALTELEQKRASNQNKKDDPPIIWANVNMEKLSLLAARRVKQELDAQLPNHIHVIPYLNGKTRLYDVDLRVGYAGAEHVCRKFALIPFFDIRFGLVHEGDECKVVIENGVEKLHYSPANPFSPGPVIGGYWYRTYDDPRRDRAALVPYREFEKAMNASKGVEFWGGMQTEWRDRKKVETGYDEKFMWEMMYKTIVFRACKHIALDPAKINMSDVAEIMDTEFDVVEGEMKQEVLENANKQSLSLPDHQVEEETEDDQEQDQDQESSEEEQHGQSQTPLIDDKPTGDGPGY